MSLFLFYFFHSFFPSSSKWTEGHIGRFRSGGHSLAMGRLSGTTWGGTGEEKRAQLHEDGSTWSRGA
jgi:hypothetical protein